jgi:glycosyltransferase involved in cell wall biosynthesis
MRFKLIQINPGPSDGRQFYPEDHDYYYQWGMGNLLNLKLIEKFQNVEYENWRLDLKAIKKSSRKLNGINCTVFPAKRFLFFQQFSLLLLKAIHSEYKYSLVSGIPIIIHFHGMHNLFFSLIAFLFPKIPYVISHHGGPNFSYKRKYLQKTVKKKIGSFVAEQIDKLGLKKICAAIPQTDYQKAYLESLGFKMKIVKIPVAGLDISRLKIMDKNEARDILKLPRNKKIILQIGRAFYNRGVDKFVELYEKNRDNSKLFFLTVDAQVGDELFKRIRSSGITFQGWIEPENIHLYLNAADVLIYLPPGEMDLNFGGIAYLPLEALACGTPVIATTLKHFPDKEILKYAKIPEPSEDIQPLLIEIIGKKFERSAARELMLKYYNWDNLVEQYFDLYNKCLADNA